jgi:hypothetical protein
VALSTLVVDEWVALILRDTPDHVQHVTVDRSGLVEDAEAAKQKLRGGQREEYVIEATQASPQRCLPVAGVKQEPGLFEQPSNNTALQGLFKEEEEEQRLPPSPAVTFEGGVVFLGEAAAPKVGPSAYRRWRPYCPTCLEAVDVDARQQLSCCGRQAPQTAWPMLREFAGGQAIMELTDDGTLLLTGTGVHRLAPYLFRGGYILSSSGSLWTSQFPLSRPEIDFLEAAMEAAAANPCDRSVALHDTGILPPPCLRYKWSGGGGSHSPFTQTTPALPSPAWR